MAPQHLPTMILSPGESSLYLCIRAVSKVLHTAQKNDAVRSKDHQQVGRGDTLGEYVFRGEHGVHHITSHAARRICWKELQWLKHVLVAGGCSLLRHPPAHGVHKLVWHSETVLSSDEWRFTAKGKSGWVSRRGKTNVIGRRLGSGGARHRSLGKAAAQCPDPKPRNKRRLPSSFTLLLSASFYDTWKG